MRLFKRKEKQPSLRLDPIQQVEHSAYLQGSSDGFLEGRVVGFDDGFLEGYNKGRAEALEEFKQAAVKSLTKGESNGKTNNQRRY